MGTHDHEGGWGWGQSEGNPQRNLTVWKARSDRFRQESPGSSMLIFELENKQRRCWFSYFNIGLVHNVPFDPFEKK